MMRRGQRPANKAELPDFLLNEFRFSHYGDLETNRAVVDRKTCDIEVAE